MLADQTDEDCFCLEWGGVFGRCFNILSNIRIYCQKFSAGLVDSLTLAILLSDLNKVQSELELYARYKWTQFGYQYFLTLFHRLVITNKYKPKINEELNVRAVKYKKNKTDNLATLVPPQRKSFIMKHLSVSALRLKLWILPLFKTFYRISWLSSFISCKAFVKLAKPFRNALLHLFHKSVIEIIDFGQKIPF